jgi:hypothetical protein
MVSQKGDLYDDDSRNRGDESFSDNLYGAPYMKRAEHKGQREKGAMSKPGLYVAVYKKGGKQKVGVLEDTRMCEKEAQERAGRLGEANRASAASATRTPLVVAKASGTL